MNKVPVGLGRTAQEVPPQVPAPALAEGGRHGMPGQHGRERRERQAGQGAEQGRGAFLQDEEHAKVGGAPVVVRAEDLHAGEAVLDAVVHLPVPLLVVAQHARRGAHHVAPPPARLRVADVLD
eukprot:52657-Hanusia_phi.AAC.5